MPSYPILSRSHIASIGNDLNTRDLVESYSWRELWSLEYLPSNHGGDATTLIKIDWVLFVSSWVFLLFYLLFDAIAGERVRGTLSLMMSNPIPRGQVLFAKYLGAFFTLIIPLLIGVLMNLLIIYLSGNIPFDSDGWLRILGMIGLFALHISIFIFLGLFFSSRVSNALPV